jgi:hypothetical protein
MVRGQASSRAEATVDASMHEVPPVLLSNSLTPV